uniref:proline--tRNA ligase n=1 Tax=Stylophora pistillata TaxID=50429 RepID=A0A2B4RCX7_STYPI
MAKLTKRSEDYSKWYNELVVSADLAETASVRGCMIIKPYGYAIWEKMQANLDKMFKDTGHQNAYFPLFVPKELFEAEEQNAEGFAKECAVVTHYRLKNDPDQKGKLIVDPEAKLENPLVVRPTSEAVIWNTYKNWIQSYRDLPILINQWANVVRWEMRTRLFLRTSEFLWQEGHTAHSTEKDAFKEAKKIQEVYADFAENFMAMPVIKGTKTANERFAGAIETYTIEALMQDGKALQAGTSHFLGQNFASAFDVKFTNKEGKQELVWATSWGVSTRLIGGLIMTHSDDLGLVLPPKLAPIQVVIIPIYKSEAQLQKISEKITVIKKALEEKNISVKFDNRTTHKPGFKFAEYELKGVPIRLAMGMRDLENGTIEIARRDTLEKEIIEREQTVEKIEHLLNEIQDNLFSRALSHQKTNTTPVDNFDDFKRVLEEKGGFVSAHWDGTPATEEKIKQLTKATIRCIPEDGEKEAGNCVLTEVYGGSGLDYHDYVAIVEEISKIDPSIGLSVAAHNSLCTNHILKFGNEIQKQKWLPKLASGEWIGAWALTEPNTGSDAANMSTTAVKNGDFYILNGMKNFISHAISGNVAVIIARTGEKNDSHGMTAFVVEKGTEGFRANKKENKLGMRASETGSLLFDNCRVHKDCVLGTVGEGFIQSMKILDGGRISIGALSLGIAKGAYEAALKYSKERQQFGKPISKFQGVSFKLSDMATQIEASELLIHKASYLKNQNRKMTLNSAMCKLYASEVAVSITNDAVQILGGYGYTKDYPVEKFLRDAKICTIGEGTSEIQRVVIARDILR